MVCVLGMLCMVSVLAAKMVDVPASGRLHAHKHVPHPLVSSATAGNTVPGSFASFQGILFVVQTYFSVPA